MDEVKKFDNYAGADRVVSSVAFAAMLKDRPVIPCYKTGIAPLDEMIGGFEPGELIVVTGPTAMGKTTLCDTIVHNLNTQGLRSLFFTYENTPIKFIATHQTADTCVYLPLEHKAMDLPWIKQRAQEAIEKYDVKTIFIDHLHYIIDMKSRNNMSLEIGTTMRFLKRDIAIGLNIPVFVVCHQEKMSFDVEPSMHHLRDSSFVAQEADIVLVVFRRFDKAEFSDRKLTTMLQGLSTVKVDKSRRLGTMGEKVNVKKRGHQLVESDQ